MPLLPPDQPTNLPTSLSSNLAISLQRGAGNIARSRLSGGFSRIRTRPRKFFSLACKPSLHWILLNIGPDAIKLRIGPYQVIIAFLLPKWPAHSQKRIGLVSSKSLQGTQPFGGRHVRGDQKMNVIRHHDKRMQVVPVQFLFAVPQSRYRHLRNLRAPQEQRSVRACVEQAVDGHERLAGRDESFRKEYPIGGKTAVQPERDKQGLLDYVPMGQPAFIMPHMSSWCMGGGETLIALKPPFRRPSRLKAGCGQYCPPHKPACIARWIVIQ